MAALFQIEDLAHAEPQGRFPNLSEAVAELRRRAAIPWDQAPNRCPCASWEDCSRLYQVVEYDDSSRPWKRLSGVESLEVSKAGPRWLKSPEGGGP